MFAVCGDTRNDESGIFPQIVEQVRTSDAELLVHTGDVESPAGAAAWKAFQAKLGPLGKPFVVAIGNHELVGATREEFVRAFQLPGASYAFAHLDARFVVLDTADGKLPDERLEWLDRELSAHPKGKDGVTYLILAMHYPPALGGLRPHGTSPVFEQQSRKLHDILVRRKVDLVLCGHEHLNAVLEWEGIPVVLSGGGGAPLAPFGSYGYYRVELSKGRIRETLVRVSPKP